MKKGKIKDEGMRYPYNSVKLVNKDKSAGRGPVNSLVDSTLNFKIHHKLY